MDENKIRKLIWQAINTHFILVNSVSLEANLSHENNKSIAQMIAIGLCNQYNIPREIVQQLLCIEPSSYNNKLRLFIQTVKKAANNQQYNNLTEDQKSFFYRYLMCSRYVRRRAVYYVKV
jgi:hypothetical protein